MAITPVPTAVVPPTAPTTLPESLVPPAAAPVTPVSSADEAALQPDERELQEAIALLNVNVRAWSTHLKFEIDDEAGRVVVKVIDSQSGDVVRQLPSEEAIEMSRSLGRLQDLAFRAQA